MTQSASAVKVTWGTPDTTTKLLTTSYVASDAIDCRMSKRMTLYPRYKAGAGGAGNILKIQVLINPYDAVTDAAGAYWFNLGFFNDAGGVMSEETSEYAIAQGTIAVFRNGVPLVFDLTNISQVKIQQKEVVAAGAAGTTELVFVKNTIN